MTCMAFCIHLECYYHTYTLGWKIYEIHTAQKNKTYILCPLYKNLSISFNTVNLLPHKLLTLFHMLLHVIYTNVFS